MRGMFVDGLKRGRRRGGVVRWFRVCGSTVSGVLALRF